jgi:hypothetical protein
LPQFSAWAVRLALWLRHNQQRLAPLLVLAGAC